MADPVETLTLSSLVGLTLGSGVVAAVLSGLITYVKEWSFKLKEQRDNAKVDAVQLIAKLELLAIKSAQAHWSFTEDMEQYKATRWGDTDYPSCFKPVCDFDPSETSRIDQSIASKLACLNNEWSLWMQMVRIKMELNANPPDIQDVEADLVALRGLRAYRIAEKLRRRYKIGIDESLVFLHQEAYLNALEHASQQAMKILGITS